MAEEETRDDQWGNVIAKKTTIWTVVTAILFIGAVFAFILRS